MAVMYNLLNLLYGPWKRERLCNDTLLMSFVGEEKVFTSIDTVINIDDAINYPVEFLNSLKPPGMT